MTAWILLSGAVGALIVFILGIWLEWRRNERERRGLLRLLRAEIEHNAEVTRTVEETLAGGLEWAIQLQRWTSQRISQ